MEEQKDKNERQKGEFNLKSPQIVLFDITCHRCGGKVDFNKDQMVIEGARSVAVSHGYGICNKIHCLNCNDEMDYGLSFYCVVCNRHFCIKCIRSQVIVDCTNGTNIHRCRVVETKVTWKYLCQLEKLSS